MFINILTFDTPLPIHFESGKGFRPFDVFVIPRLLPRSFRRRRWLFRFRSVKRFNFYSVGGESESTTWISRGNRSDFDRVHFKWKGRNGEMGGEGDFFSLCRKSRAESGATCQPRCDWVHMSEKWKSRNLSCTQLLLDLTCRIPATLWPLFL